MMYDKIYAFLPFEISWFPIFQFNAVFDSIRDPVLPQPLLHKNEVVFFR